MEIIIHLQSKTKDKNLSLAMEEYIKRTSPFCKITVKSYKEGTNAKLSKSSYVFTVDSGKDTLSSVDLAEKINSICVSGFSCIELVISKGLILADRSHENLNLCSFSMSNELTAVALIEQIYRAYTILNHITYHK